MLADKSSMRTIIQNTGDAAMENVLLQITLNRLRSAVTEQTVAKVEPGASASVTWDITADVRRVSCVLCRVCGPCECCVCVECWFSVPVDRVNCFEWRAKSCPQSVGDAKMELVMKSGGFTEISGLDTPLTIVPPGEPVIQTHQGLVDKLSGWKVRSHNFPIRRDLKGTCR